MTASLAPFTMEFIHPPIPSQVHQYYGSVHNSQLLLPSVTDRASPKLKPKPKPQPKKKHESTSLYTAASNGNLQQLKELLNERNNVNLDQPITGLTLLHFAASRGHLDVTRCLCEEYGALTDVEDREGEVSTRISICIIQRNEMSYS
jgi:ankyrin repeat protein